MNNPPPEAPNPWSQQPYEEDGIDLLSLLGTLLDRKFFILAITAVFATGGIIYALLATPIYKATAMLQVEESAPTMPGLDDMGGLFEGTSKSVTEIELLKSRTVIGEAVDTLNLDVTVEPNLFPLIGGRAYRQFQPLRDGELAPVRFGAKNVAWGGESIDLFRFEVSKYLMGQPLIIRAEADQQISLLNSKGTVLLQGRVGQDLVQGDYALTVRSLQARPGTEFRIQRNNRFQTILGLQSAVGAREKGKDSGIVILSLEHADPDYASRVLDTIMNIYVRRNVERNSAEAQKSLDFLKEHLPEVKKQLEAAEQKFNNYQIQQQSVDITLETQGVLEQIVEIETKLQELDLKRLGMSRLFKREHPLYQGVVEQIELVETQKNELTELIRHLPETQQELLRYTRDVQVSSEIYVMLLGKAQELDIVRAGTIGNVRVIDRAEVNLSSPVRPRKAMVVVLITFLGGVLSCGIVFIQRAIHKGIEDATDIEQLGMPVYASIPFSSHEAGLGAKKKHHKKSIHPLLAVKDPADLSIEALRSLRTSLHFALLEAKNNVIAISGPAPNIGKSFVASNLAAVVAQSGQSVLVVDGDLRRGDLQEQFGLKFDHGLSGYLSGQYALDEVIQKTDIDGLDMLPRGVAPPNPSELLMHKRFSDLIEYAAEHYDLVIIDTPPILAVTDPAIIGNHAGCLLLVARFGQTHKKELELTQQRFEQNGVDVRGVVFNGIVKKAGNRYGHYGYYNYEYKSKESEKKA